MPQVFGLDDCVGLALEEEQAGEDVDVGLDDEGFHRQVDAGKHPAVAQNPVADELVPRVAEDAIGQNDAHATTGLEPLDAALDEQHFGRYGGLDGSAHHEAITLSLPAAGQFVLLQYGFSVTGMSEPNGGLVISTSMEPSGMCSLAG